METLEEKLKPNKKQWLPIWGPIQIYLDIQKNKPTIIDSAFERKFDNKFTLSALYHSSIYFALSYYSFNQFLSYLQS